MKMIRRITVFAITAAITALNSAAAQVDTGAVGNQNDVVITGVPNYQPRENIVDLAKAIDLLKIQDAIKDERLLILRRMEVAGPQISDEDKSDIMRGYIMGGMVPEHFCYQNPVLNWIVDNGNQILDRGRHIIKLNNEEAEAILGFELQTNFDSRSAGSSVDHFIFLDVLKRKVSGEYYSENSQINMLFTLKLSEDGVILIPKPQRNFICLSAPGQVPVRYQTVINNRKANNLIWTAAVKDERYGELEGLFLQNKNDIVKLNSAVVQLTSREAKYGNFLVVNNVGNEIERRYPSNIGQDRWLGCSHSGYQRSVDFSLRCGSKISFKVSDSFARFRPRMWGEPRDKWLPVEIKSDPIGAEIFVDEVLQHDRTNTEMGMFKSLTDAVRIEKDGYQPCLPPDLTVNQQAGGSKYNIFCKLRQKAKQKKRKKFKIKVDFPF